MAAISGFGGRVRVGGAGGIALPAGHWTVNYRGEFMDVSTFEHGIAHDYALTGVEFEVTVDCFWDTAISIFADPPGLEPGGAFLTNQDQDSTLKIQLELYLCAGQENRKWNFSKFLLESVNMDSDVRGVVKYTLSGRATREVTFGGADPTSTWAGTFVGPAN